MRVKPGSTRTSSYAISAFLPNQVLHSEARSDHQATKASCLTTTSITKPPVNVSNCNYPYFLSSLILQSYEVTEPGPPDQRANQVAPDPVLPADAGTPQGCRSFL